jgi:hypothetical protein
MLSGSSSHAAEGQHVAELFDAALAISDGVHPRIEVILPPAPAGV